MVGVHQHGCFGNVVLRTSIIWTKCDAREKRNDVTKSRILKIQTVLKSVIEMKILEIFCKAIEKGKSRKKCRSSISVLSRIYIGDRLKPLCSVGLILGPKYGGSLRHSAL